MTKARPLALSVAVLVAACGAPPTERGSTHTTTTEGGAVLFNIQEISAESRDCAGFWLPEEGLTLPDNLGVVEDGLVFHWDAYEIAPYSMGPIDVALPYEDLEAIIDKSYW